LADCFSGGHQHIGSILILGSRLLTFHDEPELIGRPFREGKMSATVRTVFGMSSLAAAGSTATGTLRSIPSRQARTASMSSGVKSIWVILQAGDKLPGAALQHLNVNFLNNGLTASRSRFFCAQCERKSAS
jgi:hypothetical protein